MAYEGFAIDLDEAEKAAKDPGGSLTHAVELLTAPLSDLVNPEVFTIPGKCAAADKLQATYPVWAETMAQRLEHACGVLDANAAALRRVIELYRRVDGRA